MTPVPAVITSTVIDRVPDRRVRDDRLGAVAEELTAVGEGDDAGALQHGQRDREVARVLGQLVLTRLAFLLQLLEPRDDHGEQLDDDARRDVGHDAQREHRELEQRSAGEQVDQGVDACVGTAFDLSNALLDVRVGNARSRDACPDAVDREDPEGEEDLLPQVRCGQSRPECAEHS
jgi:hypothetical protein